jgi:hypothetical protein
VRARRQLKIYRTLVSSIFEDQAKRHRSIPKTISTTPATNPQERSRGCLHRFQQREPRRRST